MNVDDLLTEARAGLERLTPAESLAAVQRGDGVIVELAQESAELYIAVS